MAALTARFCEEVCAALATYIFAEILITTEVTTAPAPSPCPTCSSRNISWTRADVLQRKDFNEKDACMPAGRNRPRPDDPVDLLTPPRRLAMAMLEDKEWIPSRRVPGHGGMGSRVPTLSSLREATRTVMGMASSRFLDDVNTVWHGETWKAERIT